MQDQVPQPCSLGSCWTSVRATREINSCKFTQKLLFAVNKVLKYWPCRWVGTAHPFLVCAPAVVSCGFQRGKHWHFSWGGILLLTWSLPPETQVFIAHASLWKLLLLYLGHFSSIFNSVTSSENPHILPVIFLSLLSAHATCHFFLPLDNYCHMSVDSKRRRMKELSGKWWD